MAFGFGCFRYITSTLFKKSFQSFRQYQTLIKAVITSLILSCSNLTFANGIPTIDPIALIQAVKEYTKQLQQYKTQLQQYEDMIRNSQLPKDFVWSDINHVLNELKKKQRDLEELQKLVGDANTFAEFKTAEDYAQNPCLQVDNPNCTEEEFAKLGELNNQDKQTSKLAVANAYYLSVKTSEEIAEDAKKLQQLQQKAQSAQGTNEINQINNQIAAIQTKQLLRQNELLAEQIRQQAIKDKLLQQNHEKTLAFDNKRNYAANNANTDDENDLGGW